MISTMQRLLHNLLHNGTGEHLMVTRSEAAIQVFGARECVFSLPVVGGLYHFVTLVARPLSANRIVREFGRIKNRVISRSMVRYVKATRKAGLLQTAYIGKVSARDREQSYCR